MKILKSGTMTIQEGEPINIDNFQVDAEGGTVEDCMVAILQWAIDRLQDEMKSPKYIAGDNDKIQYRRSKP